MPAGHLYFVYLLASKRHGTLYVGVTNNLYRRMLEHRSGEGGKFTAKHRIHHLVWFEQFADIELAIAREKAIKKWRRSWKIALIEQGNPHWSDLFKSFE